jgi:MFS family permease
MDGKQLAKKSLLVVLILLSIIFSLATAFSFFAFVFSPSEKGLLQFFVISAIGCTALWGGTFYLAKSDKTQTKAERVKELKDIVVKLPMIIASMVVTSLYVFIYFMFFASMTVSKYGQGGLGGDNSSLTLGIVFFLIAAAIFGSVMFNLFKTETQDLKMTLYNQFMILKWSSLIALPFACWASYYFYSSQGGAAWVAMFIWILVFYGVYKLFAKLSDKVHETITDSNVARIIHEKRKKAEAKEPIAQQVATGNISVADELKKFKDLLDQGVITQDEFDNQKRKLI